MSGGTAELVARVRERVRLRRLGPQWHGWLGDSDDDDLALCAELERLQRRVAELESARFRTDAMRTMGYRREVTPEGDGED